MKFNPDRDYSSFKYKGYEVRIRRWDGPIEAIEIRLTLRSEIYQTMTLSFLIKDRKNLYKLLRAATRAFDKAERRLK